MIDIVYGIPLLSLLSSVCFYKGLKYFQNTYNLEVSQCSVALCHDIYISSMAVLYLNNYTFYFHSVFINLGIYLFFENCKFSHSNGIIKLTL